MSLRVHLPPFFLGCSVASAACALDLLDFFSGSCLPLKRSKKLFFGFAFGSAI